MAKLESSFMGKEVGWQPSSLLFHTAHSAWVTSSAPVASITISIRMTAKFLPTTQNSAPSSRSIYQLPSQHFSLGSNQLGLHSAMSNRDRKYSVLNKSFFFSYEYLKIWRYTDLDVHRPGLAWGHCSSASLPAGHCSAITRLCLSTLWSMVVRIPLIPFTFQAAG